MERRPLAGDGQHRVDQARRPGRGGGQHRDSALGPRQAVVRRPGLLRHRGHGPVAGHEVGATEAARQRQAGGRDAAVGGGGRAVARRVDGVPAADHGVAGVGLLVPRVHGQQGGQRADRAQVGGHHDGRRAGGPSLRRGGGGGRRPRGEPGQDQGADGRCRPECCPSLHGVPHQCVPLECRPFRQPRSGDQACGMAEMGGCAGLGARRGRHSSSASHSRMASPCSPSRGGGRCSVRPPEWRWWSKRSGDPGSVTRPYAGWSTSSSRPCDRVCSQV